MSVLHPSSIRPFLTFRPRHHVFPNASSSKHKTALLPNDGVLPTAGIFTECYKENFLSNGISLPNSAHKSVSFLYQFLVLTTTKKTKRGGTQVIVGDVMYQITEVSELGEPCAPKTNQRQVRVLMRGHCKGQRAHQV
jgi:hypothetical protein